MSIDLEPPLTMSPQLPGLRSRGVDRKIQYTSKYVTMVLDYATADGHIKVRLGPHDIVSKEVEDVLTVSAKLGWEEITPDETGDIFDEEDNVVMILIYTGRTP